MVNNKIIEEDLKNITMADLPWEELKGKNILVTGANGFVPAYIVETLLYLNNEFKNDKINVFALVRNRNKAEKRFLSYKGREDLNFIVQDVCEPINITQKIDYIIHAASQASPKFYGIDPVGTMLPNILGTLNLLRLAKEHNSKGLIFISSGEVYGAIPSNILPVKEEFNGDINTLLVRSCYAESKRAGETLCVSWNHQYKVPVKIIRLFQTYGPGMAFDDGRVPADFVADIINNRDIKLNSDGSAIRAFSYLADTTLGIFYVFFKGVDMETYNVGNPYAEISIKDLAFLLISLFPEKKLNVEFNKKESSNGYIKSQVNRISPNVSKLEMLGWKPFYSIKCGFERTIRSYVE